MDSITFLGDMNDAFGRISPGTENRASCEYMVGAYECFAALLTRMAGGADIAGMLLRDAPGNALATWGVTTMAIHLEFALDSGVGECAISLHGTPFDGYVQPSPSARVGRWSSIAILGRASPARMRPC
jgi:hypothetical protein